MNISGINIDFSRDFFSDLPPEEKSSDELTFFVLENALGKRNFITKYNENDINLCVRRLIENGYLRGTVINEHNVSWSKPTKRGVFLMNILKSNL